MTYGRIVRRCGSRWADISRGAGVRPGRGVTWPVAAICMCVAFVLAPGCGAPPRAIREPVSLAAADAAPSTRTVKADWNDVRPSLILAVGPSEMAIVRQTLDTPRERRWELTTIRDEPSELVARRFSDVEVLPGAPGQPPPETIELSATIGRFRSPAREQKLLDDVALRLEQLAGRDSAPKPKGW